MPHVVWGWATRKEKSVRFVLAIVSFVVAALLIGLGIAQKTVFAAPDEVTASASITSSAPVTVVSGEALNAYPRSQFVEIGGADTTFAAYGRTTDVLAWIGDASYNAVGFDAETTALVSKVVSGTDTEVPSPIGSDLWLASYTDQTGITINVPDDVSLMIVSDGIAPAPSEVSVTWPLDNSTPWANTIVVAGGVLLLLGLILLVWALLHMRKGRGPRRKSQKMPKLPKQRGYKAIKSKPKALEANAKGRRSIMPRVAIVPVVLVGALALGGCSSDFWAGREPVQAPTASADPQDAVEEEDQLDPAAVTELQAERIAKNVSEVAAAADASNDDTLIATRLTGPALELRAANYAQRRANAEIAAPEAIPVGKFLMILPQQTENWPRTVLAIVEDTATNADGAQLAPVSMVLVQETPRDNYKASYVMRLEPGAVIPDVAPTSVGAVRQGPDSKLLTLAPGLVAPDYADILLNDSASPSYELFEAEGDSLRPAAGKAFKDAAIAATQAVGTSSLEYAGAAATGPVVALSTNDSGAIVAVNVNEQETVKSVEAGALVNTPADVKALTGKESSGKGFTRTYGYQLLFFVPPVNTGGKIVLLGYSTATIAASETP